MRVEPAGEHEGTRVRTRSPARSRAIRTEVATRSGASDDVPQRSRSTTSGTSHASTARASSAEATRWTHASPAQRRDEVVGEPVIIPTASAWSMGAVLSQHVDRRADHLHLIAQVVASLGLLERVGANLGHSGLERLHIGAQVLRGGLCAPAVLAQRGDLAPRLFRLALLSARAAVAPVAMVSRRCSTRPRPRSTDATAISGPTTATHVGSAITTAPARGGPSHARGRSGGTRGARVAHEHARRARARRRSRLPAEVVRIATRPRPGTTIAPSP